MISQPIPYPSKANCRGFTLLEVLLVMAIMAVIVAVVIPPVQSMQVNVSLKSSGRLLAGELRYARSQAISEGIDYIFSLDDRSKKYTTTSANGRKVREGGVLREGVGIDRLSGVKDDQLTFRSDGSAEGGTIALVNGSGETLYIIVYPINGRVRISDSPPQEPFIDKIGPRG